MVMIAVGGSKVPGQAVLFCNGIGNSEVDAQASACELSTHLRNQQVQLFYNPTTLSDCINKEFNPSSLVLELAKGIRDLASQNEKVILFAHSHGVVLAEKALKMLPSSRRKIEVFAVGGATLVPNNLARKVNNYVFDGDGISVLAQCRFGDLLCVKKMKEVTRLMTSKKISKKTAIAAQAFKDLKRELKPAYRSSPRQAAEFIRDQREYRRIFEKKVRGALAANPRFQEMNELYTGYFAKYTLHVLEVPPEEESEAPQGKNLLDKMLSLFQNFAHIHSFVSYLPLVLH